MGEVEVRYKDWAERQAKVKEQEALRSRMVRDNYDPNWKRGEEPHGVMVFTDVHPPSPPVTDWQGQFDQAAAGDKVKVLARILGLKA